MAKNIITAAQRIEEKFGVKWQKVGSSVLKPPPSIPTGSLLLDEAIGDCKGYPEGAIIEAYGPQHSGKTLMGYLAISASQRAHPERDNLLIDAENQFRFQARWAEQVGVDVKNIHVSPVTSAEETFDIIEMAILGDVELNSEGFVKRVITPGNFGIIMVDSVTQLVPLEMIHKSMDQNKRMAALAAVMSVGLKKVVSAMSLTQSKTIIFFVNQTRMNPQAKFGANPEGRTGGTALAFYDTISFRVSKVFESEERDAKGKIFAHQCKLKIVKNKAGQLPANPLIFRLRYDGTGIDNDFELFNVGKLNGIISKAKPGWYNFYKLGTDELLDKTVENFKEEDFNEVMKKHPDVKSTIITLIREGKFYSNDAEVVEDPTEIDDANVVEKPTEQKADKILEPEDHVVEQKIIIERPQVEQPATIIAEEPGKRHYRKRAETSA
jgi:protein RecA